MKRRIIAVFVITAIMIAALPFFTGPTAEASPGDFSVNHEPFEWLGKTHEEMNRITGGYSEHDFAGREIFKYGNYWFAFNDGSETGNTPANVTNRFYCSLGDIITGIGGSTKITELDNLFGQPVDMIELSETSGGGSGYAYIYEYGGTQISVFVDDIADGADIPSNVNVTVVLTADRFSLSSQAGQYSFERPAGGTVVTPEKVREITDARSANRVIDDAITTMTDEQRKSGDALDNAALFVERAMRRGASRTMPQGPCVIRLSLLTELTDTADRIRENANATLSEENIGLLRDLRTGVTFFINERENMSVEFPDDISGIGFDNITIESDFVSVTLPNGSINTGSGIEIKNLGSGDETGSREQTRQNSPFTLFGIDFLRLWSIVVVFVILFTWSILYIFNHRLRAWVVPAFSVLAISINIATYLLGGGAATIGMGSQRITDTVEVIMSEGMQATISLPASEAEKDTLVLLNADGVPQLSKYNPVTGTIDASINESGVYQLKEFTVDFSDIEQKDMQMREAITQLASRNIMTGNVEGAFNPDDPITRAEFISAAIRVFDMLDTDAVSSFNDISRSDWYYAAVATAEQEGLIGGFDDNTFRGNANIPKDLMVVVTANLLAGQMGYLVPSDIEAELARYLDRDEIERWSENGAALATQSNVLIYRIDGLFAPKTTMTRGDAAVVLYKVFNKVW